MYTLKFINYLIMILFFLCYSYQFVYIILGLFRREKEKQVPVRYHHYAVLISARNEETVIRDLLDSLREQTYDGKYIHPFVVADNCTDHTARIAAEAGATVYERFNTEMVGKGYALDFLLRKLKRDYPQGFDAYLVLDADNILSPTYMEEINRKFCEGYDMLTSYRNSKNYGDSWISAGYALYFMRENRFINQVRHMNGTSCTVSGTGFLFSRSIEEEMGGWPYHLLTEDLEFSADQVARGRRIGYASKAELFDEQPVTFRQSFRQRMRWSRGYLQVLRHHGRDLVLGMLRGSFSCYDLTMSIAPAFFLTITSIICNIGLGIWGASIGDDISIALWSVGQMVSDMYLTLLFIGGVTLISEWKRIHASTWKKLLYLFTFPLYMFTYIPISVASLFGRVTWKPIHHTVTRAKMRETVR